MIKNIKPQYSDWRLPLGLGMVMCSLVPTLLLFWIDYIDFHSAMWVHGHYLLSVGAQQFKSHYQVGLILPILTTAVAIWFLSGKFVTLTRLAWSILILIVLHLIWLSYGILAFYSSNQKFFL